MRKSIAVSTLLSIAFTVVLTLVCCLLSRQILVWMQIPDDISEEANAYMFVVLLGTGATVFYNMISNMLRALGDSKTPLYFLVFSSVLNIILDIVFIVPMHMGVAGAAWATILSQFLSAVFSTVVGLRNFPILHLRREDFHDLKGAAVLHLKTGFPMGFQMSVMCIGQLAMQAVVNSLGTAAVAGYTAASKADQLSVLVNNAMMTAISNYVAQNFGAGKKDRIRLGESDRRNLPLLRCIPDDRSAVLLPARPSRRLPHLDSEYAERTRTICRMHDRACDASCCYRLAVTLLRLHCRLHRKPACLVRCGCTADSSLLSDDDEACKNSVIKIGPPDIDMPGNAKPGILPLLF